MLSSEYLRIKDVGLCVTCRGARDNKTLNCNSCRAYRKQWRLENKVRLKAQRADYQLKQLYVFGIEQKEQLLLVQGGKCACCKDMLLLENAKVDHCHKTGSVRGILCNGCNAGLGHFKDEINRLKCAIQYLSQKS